MILGHDKSGLFLPGQGRNIGVSDIVQGSVRPPVAWWPLMNDAIDINNGKAFELIGAANATANGTITQTNALIDFAPSFDGTTAYYAATGTPSFAVGAFFTISVWVNQTTLGAGYRSIVVNSAGSMGIWLKAGQNDYFSSAVDHLGATTLATGVWYHIVWVGRNTTGTSYVNGVRDYQQAAVAALLCPSTTVDIGAHASEFFNGLIQDVRIYDYAMDDGHVLDLYHAGIQGRRDDPLALNWNELPLFQSPPPVFTLMPQIIT